jgi:glycosyltransferase involved in cell wall biosynthesis
MLTLVPGGMGGSETYAKALTTHLPDAKGVSATAYVPSNARGFSGGIAETAISSLTTSGSTAGRVASLVSIAAQSGSLRLRMAEAKVVHYPFTVMLPRARRTQATVQTLLDVQHLELPMLFSRAELAYRRLLYEGAAKTADVVVTISHFAKARMVELLGIDEERIRVAHLGVDTAKFTPHDGARENFVLYPARGWQHKNHARLIEAVALLRHDNSDLRLVLTGGGLDALGNLPEWVERKGLVSVEDLHALYRSAAVLAFPSLYEGFGLPPLEAMASGCPVAASNVGSIPEVVGTAAVLFDPHDPQEIAGGISEALSRRAELTAAGAVQAARFTWEACADVHGRAYAQAFDAH